MEFRSFPKVPRLSREIIITEKIDGTNAAIVIDEYGAVFAQSRTRLITPQDDNYGFAGWVEGHRQELLTLGPGYHFGEFWGRGIQRGYGLAERRFSLFNVGRWNSAELPPACCHVVPVLFRGRNGFVEGPGDALHKLETEGSVAAPGFMDPEGIMVYHTAANQLFKKTLKGDEEGKHAEAHPRKERPAKPARDPSKGGRRKDSGGYYEGPYRRKTDTLSALDLIKGEGGAS